MDLIYILINQFLIKGSFGQVNFSLNNKLSLNILFINSTKMNTKKETIHIHEQADSLKLTSYNTPTHAQR